MKFHKSIFSFLFLCLFTMSLWGQDLPESFVKTTIPFVERDSTLYMDIYRLSGTENDTQPVMIFIFGGSFINGNRNDPFFHKYFQTLTEKQITVVSIDYRLGLRGRKVGLFNTSALDDAINMAVEDLYSATAYLLKNAGELGINPDQIMISGSSAGAITVLQADYYLHNRMPLSDILPDSFRYQGVFSFAGAIFSHKGTPDYKKSNPAPTFFFHGDNDRIVPYNKVRIFRRGMFGSKSLVKRFQKRGFSYAFLTKQNKDHSVSGSPMQDDIDKIIWFIENYVYQSNHWQMAVCWKDLNALEEKGGNMFDAVKN